MARKTKQQTGTGQSNRQSQSASSGESAIELLKQDHRKVEKLFEQFENEDDNEEKRDIVRRICSELIIHTLLEEQIFYPACREGGVEDDTMDEAQVEHDTAKMMINDLLDGSPSDEYWEAKVTVLRELIRHHVAEEEKPNEGAFAQAKENDIDSEELAEELQHRKQELQSRGAGRYPQRIVSIHPQSPRRRDEDERYRSRYQGHYGADERERGRYGGEEERGFFGRRPREREGERYYEREDGRRGWYGDRRRY